MRQDDLIGAAKFVNACMQEITSFIGGGFNHLVSLVWLVGM